MSSCLNNKNISIKGVNNMSNIPKNHDRLYFDKLVRTNKDDALLSMICATYHVKNANYEDSQNKIEIAKRLENAYNLFRGNIVKKEGEKCGAGTYTGSMDQFNKQYVLSLEMGIWVGKDYELNNLAKKVATYDITIKDYFDIVLLNYFQPINNIIVHPLYIILSEMIKLSKNEFTDEEIQKAFENNNIVCENEMAKNLKNFLIASNYFEEKNKILIYKYKNDINTLLDACNMTYVNLLLSDVEMVLDTEEKYCEYLIKDHRLIMNNHMKDTVTNKRVLMSSRNEGGINKIYYGLPGCGKSFYVQNTVLKSVDKNNIFRTTFYLEYSNSDFIGQIVPKVKGDSVTYQPIFGPFTKALKRAYETTNMVYLVIEEINRGNAAAIFGDLFQLLDRKKDTKDDREKIGDSEYPITNSFLEDYLGIEEGRVIIPSNLTIYATMNTSDQNVFPLDTAFKRRWQLERVINTWKKHPYANKYIPGTNIKWSKFVEVVNQHLISDDEGFSLEDKQIGAYFADQSMLCDNANEIDEVKSNAFCYKVIEYIWSDISKFHRDYWFNDYEKNEPPKSFDELINYMTDYRLNVLVPFRKLEV